MVAERDAHACGEREEKKQSYLKEIQTILPDVEWHSCAGDKKGSNKEGAVGDSDFAKEIFHVVDRKWALRQSQ